MTRAIDGVNYTAVSIAGPLGPTLPALSVTGTTTLSGTFQVGETVTLTGIPTFSGGKDPIVYEYQWQMTDSVNGGGWVGFDSPWTVYDPETILDTPQTKELTAVCDKEYVRLQTRATDAFGVQVIGQGTVYGRVLSAA